MSTHYLVPASSTGTRLSSAACTASTSHSLELKVVLINSALCDPVPEVPKMDTPRGATALEVIVNGRFSAGPELPFVEQRLADNVRKNSA
ncbi:hypothetical protein BJV74DRAFT_885393 [Russula compacta]|nr:hypothetical protein BJV74DRAFT_885393 [Russula compacta]